MISELKEACYIHSIGVLFDIESPPGYQCSNINTLQKVLETIENNAHDLITTHDPAKAEDIEFKVDGLRDELENLRDAIQDVRRWGFEWKGLAESLLEAHPESMLNFVDTCYKDVVTEFLNNLTKQQ